MFINKNSSHPRKKIKQILNIINDQLNKRSRTEDNLLKVKTDYELIMENAVTKKNFTIKHSKHFKTKTKYNLV